MNALFEIVLDKPSFNNRLMLLDIAEKSKSKLDQITAEREKSRAEKAEQERLRKQKEKEKGRRAEPTYSKYQKP